MAQTFRFRPRYGKLAYSAIGVGGSLGLVAVAALGAAIMPLVTGIAGVALGASYLASPAWRLVVVVDDDALEVKGPKGTKFRLLWGDVAAVKTLAESHACFVDGGAPERSLIVPGDGMPAPYDIENREALYAAILAHVAADKVQPTA